jgi:hypothetical protein
MKVNYKTYKPEEGFDEILAEIYNSVVKRYGCPITTGDEVKNRITQIYGYQKGF